MYVYLPLEDGALDLPPPDGLPVVEGHPPPFPCPRPEPPFPLFFPITISPVLGVFNKSECFFYSHYIFGLSS
jgi:hypothetical protein